MWSFYLYVGVTLNYFIIQNIIDRIVIIVYMVIRVYQIDDLMAYYGFFKKPHYYNNLFQGNHFFINKGRQTQLPRLIRP